LVWFVVGCPFCQARGQPSILFSTFSNVDYHFSSLRCVVCPSIATSDTARWSHPKGNRSLSSGQHHRWSKEQRYNKRTKAYQAMAQGEIGLPEKGYPRGGSYGFTALRDNTKKVIGKILSVVTTRDWTLGYDEHHYDEKVWCVTFTYRMDALNWIRIHDKLRPPIWLSGEVSVSAETPTQLIDTLVEKVDELVAYENQLHNAMVLAEHMDKVKNEQTK